MNYRHGYHAGNAGDVLKHAILVLVLAHLRQKPKPFVVIDTHAGAGAYPLDSLEANRTEEWRGGIGRVLDATNPPEAIRAYLEQTRAWSPPAAGSDRPWYPGSPMLARAALRPGDRLVAIEAHPETQATLAAMLGRTKGVTSRHADGYQALDALMPPPERRGLILIDPPFESRTEFADMARALIRAHRKFATGQYMLWYPIKDPGLVDSLHQSLRDSGIPRVLCVELTTRPVTTVAGMAGAGMILVNPPWRLEDTLSELLPWLSECLAQEPGGGHRMVWLRGEDGG